MANLRILKSISNRLTLYYYSQGKAISLKSGFKYDYEKNKHLFKDLIVWLK